MGHQVIKLQNPLKTLGFLQFYRFKTVKDRILLHSIIIVNSETENEINQKFLLKKGGWDTGL